MKGVNKPIKQSVFYNIALFEIHGNKAMRKWVLYGTNKDVDQPYNPKEIRYEFDEI